MSDAVQDRLQKARAGRVKDFSIAGTVLKLHKWNLDQSMEHGALVVDLVKLAVKESRNEAILGFLEKDPQEVLRKYGSKVKNIITDTVMLGNFDNKQDAIDWVDELDLENIIILLKEIWEQNSGPLVERLGIALPAALESKAQAEELKTPTS